MDSPLLEQLILCDTVLLDKIASKWSCIGLIDQIVCDGLPAMHNSLGLYVRLVDVPRLTAITVSVVDPHGVAISAGTQPVAQGRGPSRVSEAGGSISNIPLHESGYYKVTVHHAGQLLGECRLRVLTANEYMAERGQRRSFEQRHGGIDELPE